MSPDLNPVENLWQELKKRVHAGEPLNINKLERYFYEEWENIPRIISTYLVVNYQTHLLEVIRNLGFLLTINIIVRTISSEFFFVIFHHLCFLI